MYIEYDDAVEMYALLDINDRLICYFYTRQEAEKRLLNFI